MNFSYRCVDNALGKIEIHCNKIDYIPFISSYSGMVRILAGMVQVAVGIAFAALQVIHALLRDSTYVLKGSLRGLAYALHGFSNIARGCIAVFPGINLILFVYDRYIGRLNYHFEQVPRHIYPLNQGWI